jgi:MFS superfamily sulfate permease-like transporter
MKLMSIPMTILAFGIYMGILMSILDFLDYIDSLHTIMRDR